MVASACAWSRMSANKKQSGGFNPAESPRLDMTVDQLFSMLARFKSLFEESSLAKWIIMAGATGLAVAILELLRMLWLAIRYFGKF